MLVLRTFVVTTTLLQNYLKNAEASLEVLITDLQLKESSSDQYREHINEVHEVLSVIELATFCKGK